MSTTKSSPKRRTPNIRTCFIAAPFDTDLTVVKAVLHERGITPIIPIELPSETDTFLGFLRKEIKRAGLFLAILPRKTPNPTVLFEIGCAYALQKQVLIMAPSGTDLPFDLQELQHLRADAQNREALSFALDQALAPKRSSTQRDGIIEKTKALGKKAEPLLLQLRALNRYQERELVAIVASALEQSGALTVREQGQLDRGYDLAVWADELEPWVGNPLLIEFRAELPLAGGILDDLIRRVHPDPTQWVLLLYTERTPIPFQRNFNNFPRLLLLAIEELLIQLEYKSFGQIIRSLRKAHAHGGE